MSNFQASAFYNLLKIVVMNAENKKLTDAEFRQFCLTVGETMNENLGFPKTFKALVAYKETFGLTKFPMKVQFKQSLFDDSQIDEGMIGYINVFNDSDDSTTVKVVVEFKDEDLEHNKLFMQPAYRNKKNGLFELTAIEAGMWLQQDTVHMMDTDDPGEYFQVIP